MVACRTEDVDVVRALVEGGADVNKLDEVGTIGRGALLVK